MSCAPSVSRLDARVKEVASCICDGSELVGQVRPRAMYRASSWMKKGEPFVSRARCAERDSGQARVADQACR